ncbi:MAG: 30S ribosomal protein S1 [Thermodesulfovibrionales bacterium]|nr:30S ribosomal protein S1 [Thermodesulfovibrionales bacterium]
METMDSHTNVEENNIESLYEESLLRIERGDIKQGRVIAIKNDGVVVDIGYKSEGLVPINEFSESELANLKEGDCFEVFIEKMDEQGGIILSKTRAYRIRAWERLNEIFNKGLQVEGTVIERTKGGLFVDIMGIRAFLPASQVDLKTIRNLDSFIGQVVPLKVLKINQPKGFVFSNKATEAPLIVSRRQVIEEEKLRKKEEVFKKISEGGLIRGTVKNITDYGVFVDIGSVDGLLHISDISWRKVNHPSEFFKVGQEDEFVVLKFDRETEKVTLGYKQKKPDPWLTVESKYTAGTTVKGKVVSIVDYGVFVELEEGLEGLVHLSELDWAPRPKHPSKYVSLGNEVEVLILSVKKDERRLSLSIKQLKPKPWELVIKKYKPGDRVTGRVKTLTDFGAFIRLPEGVDGLIHISDISWTKHIKHPSEVLRKNQKVEAQVLSIDPERERIALGIKQLSPDPWESEIPSKFKLGAEFIGKVLKKTEYGIFVELEGEVEGLVYTSEIDNSQDIIEGGEIPVRIIKLNLEERKIGLSMKNIKRREV